MRRRAPATRLLKHVFETHATAGCESLSRKYALERGVDITRTGHSPRVSICNFNRSIHGISTGATNICRPNLQRSQRRRQSTHLFSRRANETGSQQSLSMDSEDAAPRQQAFCFATSGTLDQLITIHVSHESSTAKHQPYFHRQHRRRNDNSNSTPKSKIQSFYLHLAFCR